MYPLILSLALAAQPAPHDANPAEQIKPGTVEVVAEFAQPPAPKGPFGGFFRRIFQRGPATTTRKPALLRYFDDLYEESSDETKKWEESRRLIPD